MFNGVLTLHWPFTRQASTCTVRVLGSVSCLHQVLGFYHAAIKLSHWWKTRSIFDGGSKDSKRSLTPSYSTPTGGIAFTHYSPRPCFFLYFHLFAPLSFGFCPCRPIDPRRLSKVLGAGTINCYIAIKWRGSDDPLHRDERFTVLTVPRMLCLCMIWKGTVGCFCWLWVSGFSLPVVDGEP